MFFFRVHLAERAVESIGTKKRIVAEAFIPTRRPYGNTVNTALELLDVAIRPGNAQRGDEMRWALCGVLAPRLTSSVSMRFMAPRKSLSGPAQRAEWMPGSPPSASTTRPESSANAGSRSRGCRFRLDAGIVGECLSRFFWLRQAELAGGLRGNAVTAPAARAFRFEFAGVVGCNHRPSARVSFRSDHVTHRHFLQAHELLDALARERQQSRELVFAERGLFGGCLDFDDVAVAGHDEIGIGVGFGILGIIEIEHRRAFIDAAGYGGDVVAQDFAALIMSRAFIQVRQSASATHAPVMEAVRVPPSAWITSQSMRDLALAKRGRSMTDRRLRPIKRWISTVRPPCLPAVASRRVRSERCARQHPVLGCDPAAALALEPWRQPLFEARGHQHVGVAEFHEA